jgi:hypothetical protein
MLRRGIHVWLADLDLDDQDAIWSSERHAQGKSEASVN